MCGTAAASFDGEGVHCRSPSPPLSLSPSLRCQPPSSADPPPFSDARIDTEIKRVALTSTNGPEIVLSDVMAKLALAHKDDN